MKLHDSWLKLARLVNSGPCLARTQRDRPTREHPAWPGRDSLIQPFFGPARDSTCDLLSVPTCALPNALRCGPGPRNQVPYRAAPAGPTNVSRPSEMGVYLLISMEQNRPLCPSQTLACHSLLPFLSLARHKKIQVRCLSMSESKEGDGVVAGPLAIMHAHQWVDVLSSSGSSTGLYLHARQFLTALLLPIRGGGSHARPERADGDSNPTRATPSAANHAEVWRGWLLNVYPPPPSWWARHQVAS
jgi:hypothetical protein